MRFAERGDLREFGDAAGVGHDPATGEVRVAQLFVAVPGASNYDFADATWTQGFGDWIGSYMRAFEFFQGSGRSTS